MKYLHKVFAVTLFFATFSSYAEVAVIVNPSNSDAIDSTLVQKIFLGKHKSFADGTKIQAYSLAATAPESEEFFQKALNKTNSQYKSFWSKLVFTGKGIPPKELDTAAEMIELVKSNADAIGFIDSAQVTPDVKVIAKY